MATRSSFTNIDEYIAAADPDVRDKLHSIRTAIALAMPGAVECISYQMPALRRERVFFYFAAFKKHIGIYPPVHDANLEQELARYRGPNGNLQFPLAEPIPIDLVTRVAQSLAKQYCSRPTELRTPGGVRNHEHSRSGRSRRAV